MLCCTDISRLGSSVPKYVLAVLLGWKFYTKYKYFLSIPLVSVVICHDLISEVKEDTVII